MRNFIGAFLALLTLTTSLVATTIASSEIQEIHEKALEWYGWSECKEMWKAAVKGERGSQLQPSLGTKKENIQETAQRLGKKLAQEDTGGKPIYVTLTTIHNRLFGIGATVETIVNGDVLPTHIYIFLSNDPYLLDQGVTCGYMSSATTMKLRAVYRIYPHISVIFTRNIGSHRKLLPLLAKKWTEDCLLVTMDDHLLYPPSALNVLVQYYNAGGENAVVARRSRRMGICSDYPPWKLAPYTKNKRGIWPETKPARREMLMLPTGTGGVLYRPSFFHPVVFDRKFLNHTRTGDDLLFRLSCIAKGVSVITSCSPDDTKYTCPEIDRLHHIFSSQEKAASIAMISVFSSAQAREDLKKTSDSDIFQEQNKQDTAENRNQLNDKLVNSDMNMRGSIENESEILERKEKKKRQRVNQRHQQRKRKSDDSSYRRRQLRMLRDWENKISDDKRRRLPEVVNIQDSRKELSLATLFNNAGGNTVMWADGAKYLKDIGALDFDEVLQTFASLERKGCMLSESMLSVGAGKYAGVQNWWNTLKINIQHLYDHECGIEMCSPWDEP